MGLVWTISELQSESWCKLRALLTFSAAVISSTFVLVGLFVSAAAGNVNHHGILIGGRILSGMGSGSKSSEDPVFMYQSLDRPASSYMGIGFTARTLRLFMVPILHGRVS